MKVGAHIHLYAFAQSVDSLCVSKQFAGFAVTQRVNGGLKLAAKENPGQNVSEAKFNGQRSNKVHVTVDFENEHCHSRF